MAGHDDNAKPGAYGTAADGPSDDLKSLLDSLAHEIIDAGSRHTEALHEMQERAAALGERAGAAKPALPHTYGASMDRIEAAMSSFVERLADAEPQSHRAARHADEPDGALPDAVRSEIRRAIMSAHTGDDRPPRDDFGLPPHARNAPFPTFGESGEEVLAQAAQAHSHHPAPEAPAHTALEPAWLEARFADIAERVEHSLAAHSPHNALLAIGARFDQLEQRFDRALDEITSPKNAEGEPLKAVEQQLTDLFSQLDRVTGQLGRLDAIESRLSDLRQGLSDEQMTRLMGALAPTEEKLTALATSAAERVAESIRREMPSVQTPAGYSSDPRLVELTAMLDAFITEQRQGDALTSEALDTMQQAMQHLIDRVEAIETAQITNHEALMRGSARISSEPVEPQVFTVRTPDPVLPPVLPEVDELPHAATSTGFAIPPPAAGPELAMPSRPSAPSEPLDMPGAKAATGGLDRQALVAMARRAAEKVSSEARSTSQAPASRGRPRPGVLLVASLAAFVLAGLWLVAGSSIRDLIPSLGSGVKRGSELAPASASIARATVDAHDSLSGETTTGRIVERRAAIDADEGESGERVRTASAAAREVPDAARATPVVASTSDLMSALGQNPPPASGTDASPPPLPTISRAVELPPAMVGPLSLRHAAAKGDPKAQFEVAARFAEGKGVPQDFAQAAIWYQRAAGQGLATAQYRLGALYERGVGVPADTARARVWYKRAAEQGNLRAMHNLAVLSAGRPGTSPDYPSAVQWFTEAANRGLADSQYNLGILHESGLGVPANNIEAYKWYALAARSGDKDATRRRDAVRAKLDAAGTRSADALVIQWRAMAVEPSVNDARPTGQGWQSVRQ